MKPFDLERAIAGDPVETVNGKPVYELTVFNCDDAYNIVGIIDNQLYRWNKEGLGAVMLHGETIELVMSSVKKYGCVNLYKNSRGDVITLAEPIFNSRFSAEDAAILRKIHPQLECGDVVKYIKTVNVEYED
jgi:hypothetical protein